MIRFCFTFGAPGWERNIKNQKKAERCTRRKVRTVGAERKNEGGYFGSHDEKGMVQHGWKLGSDRSGKELDAGRAKERKICESTHGIDAAVPYCVETSVVCGCEELRELTVRRVQVVGRKKGLICHSEEVIC